MLQYPLQPAVRIEAGNSECQYATACMQRDGGSDLAEGDVEDAGGRTRHRSPEGPSYSPLELNEGFHEGLHKGPKRGEESVQRRFRSHAASHALIVQRRPFVDMAVFVMLHGVRRSSWQSRSPPWAAERRFVWVSRCCYTPFFEKNGMLRSKCAKIAVAI